MPKKGTILVVDDDINVTSILEEVLEKEGYCVETANSGDEALQKIAKKCPRILMSDVQMVGISGVDLIQKVLDQCESPPGVIMMSGLKEFGEKASALRVHFLSKPFNIEELKSVVKSIWRK